ncbi:MAG: gliding motility-associated C-terminal domain-containing protein [Bacteroidota bacterium]
MLRFTLLILFVWMVGESSLGQSDVFLHPNKGQWDDRVLYKVELGQGAFYLESDRFTYDFHNAHELYAHAHEASSEQQGTGESPDVLKRHTIHSVFKNASWSGEVVEEDRSEHYRNYYLGKDSSRWASKVYSFETVRLVDFYPDIDLIVTVKEGAIKYSFDVAPGADPSVIEIEHRGADGLNYTEDRGEIMTRFGPIVEKELSVWNENEGQQTKVDAQFDLQDSLLRFQLPNGYDTTQRLIIDPSLTFSTFTGSSSDNWGFTAAPDDDGNLFGGGIVFGNNYPVTQGAYDNSFGGGQGTLSFDIGITKFNGSGTGLVYSTFLGGSGNETPNSIVSNDNKELYILGVTSSNNFPITTGAIQSNFAGGTNTTQNSLTFNGTDIFVSRLQGDGTALLSSTYLGGTSNDGLNISAMDYNYGDQFRGEIIMADNGDVLLASTTRSNDFPAVNGFSTTNNGGQDGVAARLNDGLTNLVWSTYVGGSNDDASYALQTSSTGDLYISGGTRSNNMPLSGGQTNTFQGGTSDGYILRLDAANGNNLGGTYVGTSGYDQTFFVQLDVADEVFVFGQSNGNIPVSGGVYSNPNSGQFIQKYTTDLSNRLWSTVVGGGNGVIEISPTAFLVSNCNEIYYAGWGGQTNQSGSASSSTSNGFPVTNDAYQSTTNGNNFYVAVLDENAVQLNYATFMGGTSSSANHVDGGTSRFDKKGRIYHAVCGGCGGNANGFTTTPGVYAPDNGSSNCNLAAWKFDLSDIKAAVSAPDPYVCIPDSVAFTNNSQNGNDYFWDFGDGNTSTAEEPVHYYTAPGNYQVTFVVSDTNGCFEPDTSYIDIVVAEFEGAVNTPPDPICPGTPYQLQASGGEFYEWSPAGVLDDPSIADPTATVDTTTTFTVIVSDSCGSDTLTVTLETYGGNADVTDDMMICKGDTVGLGATGGADYSWFDPNDIIDQPTPDSAIVAPELDTEYEVEIYTVEGCTIVETIFIEVFQDVPQPVLPDTTLLCKGDEVQVEASGAPNYEWSPNTDINTTTGSTVLISTTVDRWYYVDFTNPCGTVPDSTFIDVIEVFPEAGNDTIVCPDEPVNLWASGGVAYEWKPPQSVKDPTSNSTVAQPENPLTYEVVVTDEFGCSETAEVKIEHYPQPYVQTTADYYGFAGDEVELHASTNNGSGTFTWSPTEYLSCVNCQSPTATPPESMTYRVLYIDENGCRAEDAVRISFEGIIYVPNSFTPDGNDYNEYFSVEGGNIEIFHMEIYNRWGERVFETDDFNAKWDGTYNGQKCKDGTYVWKIKYEDTEGNKEAMVGHVNLLR